MSNNREQRDRGGGTGLPITDILFGLLDRIFKDNATGKILASRVLVIIILFILFMIWSKSDDIANVYADASFEKYAEILKKERDKKFNIAIQEQLQIVHISSGADFSSVYVFRPKNLNYFVDLEVYEGKIPDSVDSRNMGGFPVDKTSSEYLAHLSGRSFESVSEFMYLPTTSENKGISYMYSCPYFNLDNIYSGTISMYWFGENIPNNKIRLESICNQAARAIGRSR